MILQKPDEMRSALMKRVRQKKTAPENELASLLRVEGIEYRRNVVGLPGSPDFANRRSQWAIFVNGCFWHHHTNCTKATIPKANQRFSREKFRANRERDAAKIDALRSLGFRVLVIWECQLHDPEKLRRRISYMRKTGRG